MMTDDQQHGQQDQQPLLGMAAMTAAAEAHAASLALFATPTLMSTTASGFNVGSSLHNASPVDSNSRNSSAAPGSTTTTSTSPSTGHHRGFLSTSSFSALPSGARMQGSGVGHEQQQPEQPQQQQQVDIVSSPSAGAGADSEAATKDKRAKSSVGKHRQCQVS